MNNFHLGAGMVTEDNIDKYGDSVSLGKGTLFDVIFLILLLILWFHYDGYLGYIV